MSVKRNNKLSIYDIIAIVSAIGLISWIITDFYGGMVIWLLSYWLIITPIILLYIFSFFDTFISLTRYGKQTSKIKLSAHGIVIFAIVAFNLYHSEIFKSDTIMTAVLKDDLYHYQLILRENGNVENQAIGPFGFSKVYHGKYKIENDLIIFSEKPYDNNFIPDTLLIDKQQGALFMEKMDMVIFELKKNG